MYNAITVQEYQGLNVEVLQLEATQKNYQSSGWITFLQAKKEGWSIKKGSKSVALRTFVPNTNKKNEEDSDIVPKYFRVFNMDCVIKDK